MNDFVQYNPIRLPGEETAETQALRESNDLASRAMFTLTQWLGETFPFMRNHLMSLLADYNTEVRNIAVRANLAILEGRGALARMRRIQAGTDEEALAALKASLPTRHEEGQVATFYSTLVNSLLGDLIPAGENGELVVRWSHPENRLTAPLYRAASLQVVIDALSKNEEPVEGIYDGALGGVGGVKSLVVDVSDYSIEGQQNRMLLVVADHPEATPVLLTYVAVEKVWVDHLDFNYVRAHQVGQALTKLIASTDVGALPEDISDKELVTRAGEAVRINPIRPLGLSEYNAIVQNPNRVEEEGGSVLHRGPINDADFELINFKDGALSIVLSWRIDEAGELHTNVDFYHPTVKEWGQLPYQTQNKLVDKIVSAITRTSKAAK